MEKLAELIPEIYYDIVARIIPGLIFILIFIPSSIMTKLFDSVDTLPISIPFLILLFSYTSGLILDSCSAFIEQLWDEPKSKDTKSKPGIWNLLDSINNTDQVKRSIKIIAETVLFRVLIFELVILGIGWIFFIIFSWDFSIFKSDSSNNYGHLLSIYLSTLGFLICSYLKWYSCTKERLIAIKKHERQS